MTDTTSQTNLDIYGSSDFAWDVVRDLLRGDRRFDHFWLATTGPAGGPHLTGIGARWFEDQLWFVSGAETQKSRNLEERPDCAIAAELPDLDVTFRGEARRVTDQPTVERLAGQWASTGWPARPGRGAIEADYDRAVRRSAALGSVAARGPFRRGRWRTRCNALALRLSLRIAAPEGWILWRRVRGDAPGGSSARRDR